MKQGIPLHVVAADINNAQKIFLISSGGGSSRKQKYSGIHEGEKCFILHPDF